MSTALDATAGEVHASTTLLAAIDGETATNVVRQELAVGGASEIGTAAAGFRPSGVRFWGRFLGEETSIASSSSHGADTRLSGFVAGADRRLSSHWFIGAGAGCSSGDLTLASLGGSTAYSTPRGLGYVGASGRRWLAHGGASVARNTYDVRRSLTFVATLPESLGGAPLFGGVDRRASTESLVWPPIYGPTGVSSAASAGGISVPVWASATRATARALSTESGADSLSLTSPDQTQSSRDRARLPSAPGARSAVSASDLPLGTSGS